MIEEAGGGRWQPAAATRSEAADEAGAASGGARLKILHCIPHLSRGGAERQLCYLAEEQQRRGYDVHVAYLFDGSSHAALHGTGVGLHRVAASGNYDPRLLIAVYRLLRTLRPDVVQSWVIQMDVLVGLCARMRGAAWVLREPASSEHYSGWKAVVRAQLARQAGAIVANSAAGAGYWQRQCPRGDVRVIANGLPLREIEAASPRTWRTAAGVAVPFLLFAGRLEPQKNLEMLLHAFARVAPPVQAVWCGEGAQRTRLQALAARLGVADRVAFLGQQPAQVVWGLMKSASALTFISRYEGLPNVVLEAIACGCPLLLSDIPAHREILSEAQFVVLDDTEQIAAGINAILRQPARARERAERALSRIAAWSIPRMADAYAAVYASVLAGEPTRARAAGAIGQPGR